MAARAAEGVLQRRHKGLLVVRRRHGRAAHPEPQEKTKRQRNECHAQVVARAPKLEHRPGATAPRPPRPCARRALQPQRHARPRAARARRARTPQRSRRPAQHSRRPNIFAIRSCTQDVQRRRPRAAPRGTARPPRASPATAACTARHGAPRARRRRSPPAQAVAVVVFAAASFFFKFFFSRKEDTHTKICSPHF